MNPAPDHGDTIADAIGNEPATLSPTPEAPKQWSRKVLGQMHRRYTTIQHSTVDACGHSYDGNRPPRTNCFWCWNAFLKTSANLEALHQELRDIGKKGLEAKYGTQFVKMFGRVLTEELTPGTYVELEEIQNGISQEDQGA